MVMKKQKIKIGYEIKSGHEIEIPLAHTVVTGLTHESGKTTAITGLIKRSGLKAIIFKTKIGEKAITEGMLIPPFYREDFDWEYAMELLESARKEKLKFERSWIIKYSNNAKSLIDFKKNIDTALAGEKLRSLDESVLRTLQAYLDKILPELQFMPLSKTLEIRDGINIMDLERFKEETQSLIIRSVINEVLQKEKNTIIVLPECWKYLPERMSSPVKRPAEAFIRQGATNNNYLWMDSQDMTGVSKTILKQVSNWILGYQREINEIKRTLDQIPLSKKNKPLPEDIATLKLGHFFVATSDFTKQVYAQPIWLEDKTAKAVAMGKIDVEEIEQPVHIAPFAIMPKEQQKAETIALVANDGEAQKKLNELRSDFINNRSDFFTKFEQINESISGIHAEIFKMKQEKQVINEDEIVMRVLQKMPIQTASTNVNQEALIQAILTRMPKTAGSVTYAVAPLEKLKKDFLEEAKSRILSMIAELKEEQKKSLKFAEAKKPTSKKEIYQIGLGNSGGYAGGGTFDKNINELIAKGLMRKDAKGNFFGNIKERIKQECEASGITEEEIEQVHSHILMELLK